VEQARESGLTAVKTSLQSLQTALAGLRDVSTWGDTQSVDSSDASRVVAVRTGAQLPAATSFRSRGLRAHSSSPRVPRLRARPAMTSSTSPSAAAQPPYSLDLVG